MLLIDRHRRGITLKLTVPLHVMLLDQIGRFGAAERDTTCWRLAVNKEKAKRLAEIIGAKVWDSGGGICLVLKHRADGRIVAFSDEGVSVYLNEEALQGSEPLVTIELV